MNQKITHKLLLSALFGIILSGCTLPPLYSSENSSSETSLSESSSSEYTSEEISSMIESAVTLVFSGTSTVEIANSNDFVTTSGAYVYITGAGDYVLSGNATNVQVQVNAPAASINLIFNGVNLASTKNAPIYIVNAEETDIILAQGTSNTLSDAAIYTYENVTQQDPNATLCSKDDLNIQGTGTLNVNGRFNHGIFSSNDLRIKATDGVGPTLNITAKNDAIKGKDSVQIENGTFNLGTTNGDAIQADSTDTVDKGFILIMGGTFDIQAGDDGLQGYRYVQVDGGDFTLHSVGKGIISDLNILINDGTFDITSTDDAVHSTGTATLAGGNFTVSSNDDGYHAETTLTISGGSHTITKSFEGLEATTININGGTTRITSSDDGLNAAGGDGSSTWGSTGTGTITITDGFLYVNAVGDGLDSNGSIFITGGTTLVNGPTNDGNGPLDCGDQSGYVSQTGGTLIATGSSGMAVGVTSGSQYSALVKHTSAVSSASQYVVVDASGNPVVSFKPAKNSYSIAVSSSLFASGGYKLYSGGTLSNPTSTSDGYSLGGTYAIGTELASWTFSSTVVHYSIGSSSGPGGH